MNQTNSLRTGPDEDGHFGKFGGRYVAETLMPLILELEREYKAAKVDPRFARSLTIYSPTLSVGRARSIMPSGSPSISAALRSISSATSSTTPARTRSTIALGQILLALRMGKTRYR